MKNKTTQTEQALLCVSKGCQCEPPGSSRSRGSRSEGSRSPTPRSPTPRSPTPHSLAPGSPTRRKPSLRSPGSHNLGSQGVVPRSPDPQRSIRLSPGSRNPVLRIPAPCNPGSGSHDRASPALSLPRHTYRLKRPERTVAEEPPLYKDDLINIIGERNDKRLRLLYSSPERDDYPSFMNLFPLPNDRQEKPGGLKKFPPWR